MAAKRDLQKNRKSRPSPRTAVPRNRGISNNDKARRRSADRTATKSRSIRKHGSARPRNIRKNRAPSWVRKIRKSIRKIWKSEILRAELQALLLFSLVFIAISVLVKCGCIRFKCHEWTRDELLSFLKAGSILIWLVKSPFAKAALGLLIAVCLAAVALL